MELTDNSNNTVKIALLRTFTSRPLLSLEDDKRYFTDFEDETQKILLTINTNENALIIGDRGSGKTSLFNHIIYHLKKNNETVPIRMNALRMEKFDQTSFLSDLLFELVDVMNKYESHTDKFKKTLVKMAESGLLGLPGTNIPNTTGSKLNYDFSRKDDVDTLLNRLSTLVNSLRKQGITLCILLDDSDKIGSDVIWSTFRGIRDSLWELRISIIMTVLPNQVSEITKPPLDHFFQYWIKLKPFDKIKTKEFLKKRLTDSGILVEVEDDAVDRIVEKTKGNPRSLAEIFKYIFENNPSLKIITKEQVENFGIPYSPSFSDIERAVFNYLIHKPYTSASSEDFVKNIGVSRSRIAQILNELKDKQLIASKKEGKKVQYFITSKGVLKRQELDRKDS